jgi:LysM repeat protein
MKRHHGNLLARPSLKGMISHYYRETKAACVNPGLPRKKRFRGYRKRGFHGSINAMLTALIFAAYIMRAVCAIPVWQFRSFPRLAYSGLGGGVIALLIVFSFARWPQPNTPLNFTGLLSQPQLSAVEFAWAQDDAATDMISQIPVELFPHYVDPVAQNPFMIASSSLPGETWREPRMGKSWPNVSIANINPDAEPKPKTPAVPLTTGIYHTIRSGDNLWDLSQAYGVSHKKLCMYNYDINPNRLRLGQKIFIPGINSPLPDIPIRHRMILPIKSPHAYVISAYGNRKHPIGGDLRFHRGVDLQPVRIGTPIYAVLDGVVEYSGRKGGKGLLIELKHENGLKTLYAHNSRLHVKKGQKVKQGQHISNAGNTGYSTGPHLHFEVWENGKHVDPLLFLPKIKVGNSRNYTISR